MHMERGSPSVLAKVTQVSDVANGPLVHLYGDITIAEEGLQNFGLCSALRALKQVVIFIVPHLL
jgi:hypothetical protein